MMNSPHLIFAVGFGALSGVLTLYSGVVEVILGGLHTTAQSVLGTFNTTPLSVAVAIAVVLASMYLVTAYIEEEEQWL